MLTEAYQKQLSILEIALAKESQDFLSGLKTDCLEYLTNNSEIILKIVHIFYPEETYGFLKAKAAFFLSSEERGKEKLNLAELLTLCYVLEECSSAIEQNLSVLKKKKRSKALINKKSF